MFNFAAGDIIQAVIKGRYEGQEVNNVLHFRANNGNYDAAVFAADLAECVLESLIGSMAAGYTFDNIGVKRVYPNLSPEYIWVGDFQNGSGGAGLPSFSAALLSFQTEKAGKSGKGRLYVPAVSEASTNGSTLNDDGLTWLLEFAICLATKFVGDSLDANLGVVSRKIRETNPGDVANWFAEVTSIVARHDLATMRSRKVGRGS